MSKNFISISFDEQLSDEKREEALAAIGKLSGVFKAAMLTPDEKKIGYAYSDEEQDPKRIAELISHIAGVKLAKVAAPRFLVD